jgi:hypothetical protein
MPILMCLYSSSSKQCTSCMETIKGIQICAPCGHSYDKECIADLFQASTRDSTLFPPRCCRQQIPVDLVRPHLSVHFLSQFEAKMKENSTVNRVYCANPTCSQFLGPQVMETGWWYGLKKYTCPATGCQTITCGSCKQKIGKDNGDAGAVAAATAVHVCNKNQVDQPVFALGKREGWVQCPGCGQMIELQMGCYHMTCLCKTEFCYLCRAIWRTCSCLQWDEHRLYAAAEERVDQQLAGARYRPNLPRADIERRRETQVRTFTCIILDAIPCLRKRCESGKSRASVHNHTPGPYIGAHDCKWCVMLSASPNIVITLKNAAIETPSGTQRLAANPSLPGRVDDITHPPRLVHEKPQQSSKVTSTSSRTALWVQTLRNPSSSAETLFSSAEVARRRRSDLGNDPRRAALINAAAEELLRNHDCRHDVYGWSRGPKGVCQMCRHYLPIYLFVSVF